MGSNAKSRGVRKFDGRHRSTGLEVQHHTLPKESIVVGFKSQIVPNSPKYGAFDFSDLNSSWVHT